MSPGNVHRPLVMESCRVSLSFPNSLRSYDTSHHRVRFVGYDGISQISFFLESDALARIDARVRRDEASALSVFDKNIERILDAAAKAYRGTRRHSYLLGAQDF